MSRGEFQLRMGLTRNAVAPHIAVYKGNFYMCAVTEDLLRSSHPMGPWEFIGEFKDEKRRKHCRRRVHDVRR